MTLDFPQDAGINLGKALPDVYAAMGELARTASEAGAAVGLPPLLIELVRMRVSQINGCAFCLRMHTRDAIAQGETTDRLAVLAAWWETAYFSPDEQQALLIAERITLIAAEREHLHPTRPDAPLSDEQIAAVAWLATVMNAWNRVAVSSHYSVKP